MEDIADEIERQGGCDCRRVRYRMRGEPIVVQCCHCRWCQRETGASFALNAVIETERVVVTGQTVMVDTPSESGKGQKIARCPRCYVALWSHYPGSGRLLSFMRVGTLDQPDTVRPEIHIYTASKQPWVILPEGATAFEQFYDPAKTWGAASLARFEALRARQPRNVPQG